MATSVAFVVMAVFAAVDLLSDLRQGTTFGHVFAEGGGLAARSLIATTRFARGRRQ